MAISKARPVRFTPTGLVDAFDATGKFPGACRALTNLVFDQANPELVVCRPGVVSLASMALAGFANPTFISLQVGIGTRIYGMVTTTRNAGNDEPFCFDTASGLFVTISGVTAANTPASQPSSGSDWTPPTAASIGVMIAVTHPGFPGTAAHFYGVFDLSNPAAPAWRSENTTTNALPSVPTSVANFFNRAWFACGNIVFFTDVLTNPFTITNATQQLTIGDSAPINAQAGLPLQTTSSGIIGALTIFKKTQIWQVTGDQALFNISLNYISLTVGTNAPRTIAQAPAGLYFMSTGGPYFITLTGAVLLLTYDFGPTSTPDVMVPFQNAITPTRWCGAYNSSIYRLCGPTSIRGVQGTNDYWFDERKRRWTGPHSFAYDCASAVGGFFVLSSANYSGVLVQSLATPALGFVGTDLTAPMSVTLLSSTFPKIGDMFRKQVAESQIELAATGGVAIYTITAQDEQGNTLGTAVIAVSSTGVPWGYFVWGDGSIWSGSNVWGGGALWGSPPVGSGAIWGFGSNTVPHTFPVPWAAPLVFEKMALLITAPASLALGIGTFYARYQTTGYMTPR